MRGKYPTPGWTGWLAEAGAGGSGRHLPSAASTATAARFSGVEATTYAQARLLKSAMAYESRRRQGGMVVG